MPSLKLGGCGVPKYFQINFHFFFLLASILGISRNFIFIAKVGILKKI
jgi:hypothetical protein